MFSKSLNSTALAYSRFIPAGQGQEMKFMLKGKNTNEYRGEMTYTKNTQLHKKKIVHQTGL